MIRPACRTVVSVLRCLAGRIVAGMAISVALILPVQAQVTNPPASGFEYFFSTPSLNISSATD